MLELYHCDPNANSGKPMMALHEKGVPFVSHYVDLPNFGAHDPEFLKVNPEGKAPVLVHDGRVLIESTQMCEYIDEAFEGPPLRPEDPRERWRMRWWSGYMDRDFGPSLSMIAWSRFIGPMHRARPPEELERLLSRVPDPARREAWRTAIFGDFAPGRLEESFRRLGVGAQRLEEALRRSPWVAGSVFSIGDIVAFNMAGALPRLFPDMANAKSMPRLTEWIERMRDRPGIRAALAMDRGALRNAGRPPT